MMFLFAVMHCRLIGWYNCFAEMLLSMYECTQHHNPENNISVGGLISCTVVSMHLCNWLAVRKVLILDLMFFINLIDYGDSFC
jgi:hypothetical protein